MCNFVFTATFYKRWLINVVLTPKHITFQVATVLLSLKILIGIMIDLLS